MSLDQESIGADPPSQDPTEGGGETPMNALEASESEVEEVKEEAEEITFEELGGADVHSMISGTATLSLESEAECFEYVRKLLLYLPSNNLADPPKADPKPPRDIMFEQVIPDDLRQPYDIHSIIDGIADVNSFFELQPDFAANVVIGFARIEGMSVGMVASQPNVLAGTMTVDSSDKVARFVRFCDAFNIPIITLQDVPGYLPGVDQEHDGQLPLLDKLLHEGMAHPGRDIPVDGPHVVPGLVLPDLGKLHPPPLEDRMVLPAEQIIDQIISTNLNPPNLFQNIFW